MDGNEVSKFSTQAKKFTRWYENIDIIPLLKWEYDQTMFFKYSYMLKTDINPNIIREYYSYCREKRENWEREIASRVYEEIIKIWLWQIWCRILTNTYYIYVRGYGYCSILKMPFLSFQYSG